MKRFLLGVAILGVFLGLGLWTGYAMEQLHVDISQTLEQAAAQVLDGQTEQGVSLARQAHTQWQDNWHMTAFLADHAPMDEIDALFAQALFYADTGNAEDFASHCTRLSMLVEAVGEAHALSWWNLL